MLFEHLLDILAEFGGGRGPTGNSAVRFLLAAFFWTTLAYVSGMEWRNRGDTRDRLILLGALLGIVREFVLFGAEYGSYLGYVSFSSVYPFFPPVERALTMLSGILIAYAFLRYFAGQEDFSTLYLRAAVPAVAILYVVVALAWLPFLQRHPRAGFGAFWGDMAFRLTQTLLLGVPVAVFAYHRIRKASIPVTLLVAMSFLLLDEILMAVNLYLKEVYVSTLAPLSHNLHIWAIPIFTWVYWEDLQSREHEARHRSEAIVEAVGDGLSIQNRAYEIVYQNHRHRSMFGDEVGHPCYSVLDDADRPCERCPMERMFATGQAQKVERWLPSLGRYLEISATPLRDASGQIVAGLELIHDLTARRVTERALFESEQRFRNIFQESAEPVLLVSAVSGSIVDANEAATSLLGYKKKDLVRNGFTPLMTHSEVSSLQERLLNPELKEGFAIERQKMYRQDGEILILTFNARLIRLRGENVYYCSLWDLTEKVRLDEYWRQSLEKLIQAEKMAFLGTMVSGFAHDINNPNQLVASNISLLSEVWPDAITALDHVYSKNPEVYLGGLPFAEICEAVPRAIRDIRVGSDRISKIVSNLMSFARSEETTLKDSVHINEVVEGAIALLRHRIRKQTEHFRFAPGEGIPAFPGNRQRLEQVIINLISNSLESLADPGAAVVVLTDYCPETEEVVVKVEDEGAGIPADILNRIQEPFFTTKQGRGGSGLGLTISRVFVQEHGGLVSFESRAPAQGTRAIIRLPVRKKAEVSSVTYL